MFHKFIALTGMGSCGVGIIWAWTSQYGCYFLLFLLFGVAFTLYYLWTRKPHEPKVSHHIWQNEAPPPIPPSVSPGAGQLYVPGDRI
jgi:hypothetical protein